MERASTVSKSLCGLGCILLLVFTSTASAIAQTCVRPPLGIIAQWSLDETSGTIAEDIVGNNAGMHVGGPVPAAGLVDGALRFDGIDDYVVAPDSDLWAFGSHDFTIEFWANFAAPAGGSIGHPSYVFIGNDEGPFTTNKWFFALGGGFLNFHINGPSVGSTFFPLVSFSPNVRQWQHLTITRNANTYTIFIDGVPSGSASDTRIIPNPDALLAIGRALEPFGGFMNGRLDEMTIYHRALSEAELQAIVTAGSAGKCKNLAIDTASLSAGKFGEFFSQEFKTVFGAPPLAWSIIVTVQVG